jgi:hypothetical protein
MGLCRVDPNPSPFKEVDKILELREAKGDLELEDLNQVPYLRLTPQLIKCLDFTPFEDKEGLGERRGSLDERHRERVRTVDQLEEEWEGTGSRHPSGGMAHDFGLQVLNPVWPPSFLKSCQPPSPLSRVMTSAPRWNKSLSKHASLIANPTAI